MLGMELIECSSNYRRRNSTCQDEVVSNRATGVNSEQPFKRITPHRLMSLFGAQPAIFHCVEEGLQVVTKKNNKYLILMESLADEAVIQEGMWFARLVLQTNGGPKTFFGLRKKDARALLQWTPSHWLRQLAPEVSRTAQAIRTLLAQVSDKNRCFWLNGDQHQIRGSPLQFAYSQPWQLL